MTPSPRVPSSPSFPSSMTTSACHVCGRGMSVDGDRGPLWTGPVAAPECDSCTECCECGEDA